MQSKQLQSLHVVLTFDSKHNPLRLPPKTASERPRSKVVRASGAFNTLTSKCASRHNGVHSFDISTSKSAPKLRCFVHFDFDMFFAPTACTFEASQLQIVVRTCGACTLTSKCASRHNGVHFFDISTSKSGRNMVCFVNFDFHMYFAPQRRALFRHPNFKKCSEAEVFCAF